MHKFSKKFGSKAPGRWHEATSMLRAPKHQALTINNLQMGIKARRRNCLLMLLSALINTMATFFDPYFGNLQANMGRNISPLHLYMVVFLFSTVIYVFLLLCLCILIVCLCIHRASWNSSATLTEVFPCFFLSCKANARV
jgi:ABC-type transport system involved in cytochrome bd biosynthesis fused ATPase/permease subunit